MSDLCINSGIYTTVNNLNCFITVYIAFCCINITYVIKMVNQLLRIVLCNHACYLCLTDT